MKLTGLTDRTRLRAPAYNRIYSFRVGQDIALLTHIQTQQWRSIIPSTIPKANEVSLTSSNSFHAMKSIANTNSIVSSLPSQEKVTPSAPSIILIGYRSDKDDANLGLIPDPKSLHTIIDTTTDSTRHFAATHRTTDHLELTQPCQFDVREVEGVSYCWIGLRTRKYAKRVLGRMRWWEHW